MSHPENQEFFALRAKVFIPLIAVLTAIGAGGTPAGAVSLISTDESFRSLASQEGAKVGAVNGALLGTTLTLAHLAIAGVRSYAFDKSLANSDHKVFENVYMANPITTAATLLTAFAANAGLAAAAASIFNQNTKNAAAASTLGNIEILGGSAVLALAAVFITAVAYNVQSSLKSFAKWLDRQQTPAESANEPAGEKKSGDQSQNQSTNRSSFVSNMKSKQSEEQTTKDLPTPPVAIVTTPTTK